MKPQDVIFFIVILFLLYKNNPRFLVLAGLLCLILSMPLFALWIFFTAERLIWYASGFFLVGILMYIMHGIQDK